MEEELALAEGTAAAKAALVAASARAEPPKRVSASCMRLRWLETLFGE